MTRRLRGWRRLPSKQGYPCLDINPEGGALHGQMRPESGGIDPALEYQTPKRGGKGVSQAWNVVL